MQTTSVKCEIKPTTKRLKQLIKEYGNEWVAITPIANPQCLAGNLGVKVKSSCGSHVRWVRYPEDIYFI